MTALAYAIPYIEPLLINDVERRVMRACKTIRVLNDPDARFLNAGIPKVAHLPLSRDDQDAWFAYDVASEERPRFRPTPFDVSDVLVALGWCCVLERRDFKIVWWRSLDWSFAQMALRLGRTKQRAQQRYREAMLKVWERAQR